MTRNAKKGGVFAAAGMAAAGALGAVVPPEAKAATPNTTATPTPMGNGSLYWLKSEIGTTSRTDVTRTFDGVGSGGAVIDHPVTLPATLMDSMVWSPDGTKVAIEVKGTITVYAADFSNPVVVAAATATDTNDFPHWLPDGSGLAYIDDYTSQGSGYNTLRTVNADGTGAAKVSLPAHVSYLSRFDITPAGDYVLLNDTGGTPVCEIDEYHPGAANTTLLKQGCFDGMAVSPDGADLALLTPSDYSHPEYGRSLELLDLSTKAVTQAGTSLTADVPVWSPDGKFLAAAHYDPDQTPGSNHDLANDGSHPVLLDIAKGTWSDLTTPGAWGWYGGGHWGAPLSWRPIPASSVPPPGGGGGGGTPPPNGVRAQVDRVAGKDRVETAIATSQLAFNDKGTVGGRQAQSAVLSRSDTFADALAGGALAAHKHGPLLLTPTGSLDPKVATELTRVLAPHSNVYLLGGTGALSDTVMNQVAALGFNPMRVWGVDRDATAVAIAKQITPTPHTFLVATGRNFPDALAAGAAAGAQPDAVVLLSDDNALPAATKDYLSANHHSGDVVLGVGNQGSNALASAFAVTSITSQLRGHDRFDTAEQLADFYYSNLGAPKTVGVATGYNWPDALGGGALLGQHPGPLLLTDASGVSGGEASYLTANAAQVQEIVVFGGTSVVSQAAEDSVANTAKGAGNWDGHVNRLAPSLP